MGPKVNVTPYGGGYSMAKPADQRQIAKEIEKRAAELGKTDADDAPFNFQVYCFIMLSNTTTMLLLYVQGMLKKTNINRNSLKRAKETNDGEGSSGKLPFDNRPTNSSVVYQSKPGQSSGNVKLKYQAPTPPSPLTPNKHQIAPGLVIEGEEADL